MKVSNANGNYIFDDADDLCFVQFQQSQGKWFAFVQAIDVGFDGSHRNTVRYWGEWSDDDKEGAMIHILERGGKWPDFN